MHFKKQKAGILHLLGAVIAVGLLFGYPIFGLKMPQKDNPFYYRVKYGSVTTLQQMQNLAMVEYGNTGLNMQTNVMYGPDGFSQYGNGIRMDLDNYRDLVC